MISTFFSFEITFAQIGESPVADRAVFAEETRDLDVNLRMLRSNLIIKLNSPAGFVRKIQETILHLKRIRDDVVPPVI